MSTPPIPTVKSPPMGQKRIDEIYASLAKMITAGYDKNPTVKPQQYETLFDLWVVTAAIEHAYPGSGVARVLVDKDGVTYGVRGDKDLADLIRARGWLASPPDAISLRKLVDFAHMDGVGMMLDDPPVLTKTKDGLLLTFYTTAMPPGPRYKSELTVGATGKATLTHTYVKK